MSELLGRQLFPTVELMVQWYVEFNEQFFDGELEEIELRVGRLEKNAWMLL